MAKRGSKKEKDPHHQEKHTASLRGLCRAVKANRVVVTQETENRHEHLPGDFGHNVWNHKWNPRISSWWQLPLFVNIALNHKVRHHLLNQGSKHNHNSKHGKHLVLQALHRVVGFPVRDTNKKWGNHTERNLGVNIGRCAPKLLRKALGDLINLGWHGRSKGGRRGHVSNCGLALVASSCKRVKVLVKLLVLARLLPNSKPILWGLSSWCSSNCPKHPFGRIGIWWTLSLSAVALKVVNHSSCARTNIAKVNRFTALFEQQKTIKLLKKQRRGLMNGTHDSLATLRKLFHERADGPCCLRIETWGGLI